MKKTMIALVLVLLISTALVTGTLAVYSTNLDLEGQVNAKEFIFMEDDDFNTFEENIKIAPTEEVNFNFAIQNYDGQNVTETDMFVSLALEFGPKDGKSNIMPLDFYISETDENGNVIKEIGKIDFKNEKDTGITKKYMNFTEAFYLNEVGQKKFFNVKIKWESTENDLAYAGANFSNYVKVKLSASQLMTMEASSNRAFDEMAALLKEVLADKANTEFSNAAFQEKYGFAKVNTRNDTISDYILEKVYNGAWNAFLHDGEFYYVTPYVNFKNNEHNIVIFAKTTPVRSWNAKIVYDYETGIFYENQKGYSINDKSHQTIMDEIKSDRWTVIEVK